MKGKKLFDNYFLLWYYTKRNNQNERKQTMYDIIFANIEESYIAKDIECIQENIKDIVENRDTSNEI